MKNTPQTDVELHELFEGRLKIFQKKHGYRFSIDAILLASFVIETATGAVADLGTGGGVLPVLLARHKKFNKIIGIEIQDELA
ncbi:MAG: SAM-dependent methyltransferase, partial [Pseudomonadota bacterium]